MTEDRVDDVDLLVVGGGKAVKSLAMVERDKVGGTCINVGLRRHKESVVDGMVSAHRKLFADSGMDFVMGVATFVAERTVKIGLNDGGVGRVRGRDVVVNTGTAPALPPLDVNVGGWSQGSAFQMPVAMCRTRPVGVAAHPSSVAAGLNLLFDAL